MIRRVMMWTIFIRVALDYRLENPQATIPIPNTYFREIV